MENRPAGIKANRKTHVLTIKWVDGHNSDYSFTLLRYACPCVTCRGGHEYMSDKPDPFVFTIPLEDTDKTRLVNVDMVGSYAISIQWEDGHSTGIYNWDYLRALCSCNECQSG